MELHTLHSVSFVLVNVIEVAGDEHGFYEGKPKSSVAVGDTLRFQYPAGQDFYRDTGVC